MPERLGQWLNGPDFQPQKGMEIAFAVLKAILAHLHLAWIHSFGDGNGRTARRVEFVILIRSGVPAPAAHLLSNHYNQTRSELDTIWNPQWNIAWRNDVHERFRDKGTSTQ